MRKKQVTTSPESDSSRPTEDRTQRSDKYVETVDDVTIVPPESDEQQDED